MVAQWLAASRFILHALLFHQSLLPADSSKPPNCSLCLVGSYTLPCTIHHDLQIGTLIGWSLITPLSQRGMFGEGGSPRTPRDLVPEGGMDDSRKTYRHSTQTGSLRRVGT